MSNDLPPPLEAEEHSVFEEEATLAAQSLGGGMEIAECGQSWPRNKESFS